MRVLVTGIAGFVGPVVAAALARAGHEVHGLALAARPTSRLAGRVRVHAADLRDPGGVGRVVRTVAPDAVVHLGATTFVPEADGDPVDAYAVNVGGTVAVLAAIRAAVPGARLVYASSADAYGRVDPAELPVREETPLRPLSVYGATKAAAEVAVAQWHRAHAVDVVVVRPFNHTGAGQDARFVCAAFARQIARAEAGLDAAELAVGNTTPVRDFSDVRDVAAGYVAALERGRAGGVYNLCAGQGVSIAEVIGMLRAAARVPIGVRVDPARCRPVEIERLVGSSARAATELAWRPTIRLEETLRAVLDDWRRRVGSGD